MAQRWTRLIRFVSGDQTFYGDAVSAELRQARVIVGNPFAPGYAFGEYKPVTRLLSPIAPSDVGTVRLLGLNFRKHAAEAGAPAPKHPVVLHKPATAVAGPADPIVVPAMAQVGRSVDYEVELVAVIGRTCRNVSAAEALRYVAGFTVGNDVSQRTWQFDLGGGQWNVSKGFDGWAPLGPAIVPADQLPPADQLRLRCTVNGEERQSELVSDMIFGVGEALAFLSQGQTLLPGDLVFMGTPAGVGMGFKPEPRYLQHGDVVECSLTGVGTIRNAVVFTETGAKL